MIRSMRPPKIVMEEITDPVILAKAEALRERFERNFAWFQDHADEIFSQYRGKHICIAGRELFSADTAPQAIALARAAHPDDDGRFTYRVPLEKIPRIYAS